MDSRSNLFIVVTTVLLAILIAGGVVVESLTRPEVTAPDETKVPPQESVNTELLFAEEARKYDDTTPPFESTVDVTTTSGESDEPDITEPEPVTATATTTPIPTVSITVGGITQVGTLGSYCWEGTCTSAIIGDIPGIPLAVSASGTVSYTIDSEVSPERVLIFLKKPNTTNVIMNRELTVPEVFSQSFGLDLFYGEHLLFITGVFPGNQDVVHAFKIDIQ